MHHNTMAGSGGWATLEETLLMNECNKQNNQILQSLQMSIEPKVMGVMGVMGLNWRSYFVCVKLEPRFVTKTRGKPAVACLNHKDLWTWPLGQVQVHAIKSSTCLRPGNPQKRQLYLYILSTFECHDFTQTLETAKNQCLPLVPVHTAK